MRLSTGEKSRRPDRAANVERATRRSMALALTGLLLANIWGAPLAHAQTTPTDVTTNWRPVKIGGGGYVTGMVIHPQDSSVMYLRSDMGPFRWDSTNSKWVFATTTGTNDFSCESLAVDPKDKERVYFAIGNGTPSDIIGSSTRGTSYFSTNFKKSDGSAIRVEGNGSGRGRGERLSIDPNNGNIGYYASIQDGLWKTSNLKGTTPSWSQVSTFTYSTSSASPGVFTTVDENTDSSIVYVGISGTNAGIYRSTNGGTDWTKVPDPSGIAISPRRGHVGPDGTLWVAHDAGVARYRRGAAAMENMTPWTNSRGASAVNVSATNPDVVVAISSAGEDGDGYWRRPIWRTQNATATTPSWRQIAGTGLTPQVQYTYTFEQTWKTDDPKHFSAATTAVVIDPLDDKKVWFGDFYAPWRCNDATASVTNWQTVVNGYETLVIHGLSTPPAGAPLFSYTADNDGFRHTDLTAFPVRNLTPMGDGSGFDYCEEDPYFVAHTGGNSWGANGGGGVSRDNGLTWTAFGSGIGYNNETYDTGKIAVGATKLNNGVPNLVWLSQSQGMQFSRDAGKTWTASSNAPAIGTGYNDIKMPIAADRVNGNKFYALRSKQLYASTDGGASWNLTATLSASTAGFNSNVSRMETMPGKEGEVWVFLVDRQNNYDFQRLYRITGASSSATAVVTAIANVGMWNNKPGRASFALGAPNPARTEKNPAIYVLGTVNGVQGIFRSDDLTSKTDDGATAIWVRLFTPGSAVAPFNNHADYLTMAGDRQTYGRLYVGTSGRGLFVGDAPGTTTTSKGTGKIYQEVWTGVSGATVDKIPTSSQPNSILTLTEDLEGIHSGDNYGTRIRGYITAPTTGSYVFWIAGDDATELWLSTNDQPGNKTKIASGTSYTSARQWTKYTSQKSVGISLTAGQRYYVEVLCKEGSGGDHVAVGWSKPGDSTLTATELVPGSQLSPYTEYSPYGTGTGLKGEYHSNQTLSSLFKTQTDPKVDFNWGSGSPNNLDGTPMSSVSADGFSVRWSGQVQALEAGNYTFTTNTDDGVRLWLDDATTPQIDKWQIQSGGQNWTTSAITLAAGQKINVKMEYYEATGNAQAQLKWRGPGDALAVVIPQKQLYPAMATKTPVPVSADAYVRDGSSNTGSNFGAEAELKAKRGDSGVVRESYLKFNTSSVSGTVSKATLRVYGALGSATTQNTLVNVYSVSDNSWIETGMGSLTWSNKPVSVAMDVGATVSGTTGAWYEFDVTDWVKSERAAGDNTVSFRLKSETYDTAGSGVNFDSMEKSGGNAPQLILRAE